MRPLPKRLASVLLLGAFLPQASGCVVRKTRQVEPATLEKADERVVGVTTFDGRSLEFDPPGGGVRGDTVFASIDKTPFQIPLDQVQRVWVKRTDPGLTTLANLGILAGALGVAGVIALATKESCPFIYSWDGERYVFDAEPYGGAISRGLERDDYGILERLRAVSGVYRLMVTNEVNETQMTNLLELWVVDHRPGARVVPDEGGRLHSIAAPVSAGSARDREGRDLTSWLAATDRKIWESLPLADSGGSVRDEVVLTFLRPAGASHARLVANVGTGIWGSHMIREMLQLRGREVGAWYARVDGSEHSRDSLRAWNFREELYALKVEVEVGGGWRLGAALPGAGPFVTEDRVVPLDLRGVTGDSVRLRLRPPRGFWALNSFALDFGTPEALPVDTLRPLTARDVRWGDMLSALAVADDRYYAMPYTGDRGYVTFAAPPEPGPGLQRTVIAHTRGYYRLHLPIGADPDTAALRRIAEVPDGAARLAAEEFGRWRLARRE